MSERQVLDQKSLANKDDGTQSSFSRTYSNVGQCYSSASLPSSYSMYEMPSTRSMAATPALRFRSSSVVLKTFRLPSGFSHSQTGYRALFTNHNKHGKFRHHRLGDQHLSSYENERRKIIHHLPCPSDVKDMQHWSVKQRSRGSLPVPRLQVLIRLTDQRHDQLLPTQALSVGA